MTLNKQFVALRNGMGESSGCTGNTLKKKKVQGESVKQLSTTLLILIN